MGLLKLSSITRKRRDKPTATEPVPPLVSPTKLEPLTLNLDFGETPSNPIIPRQPPDPSKYAAQTATVATTPPAATTTTPPASSGGLLDDIFSELNTLSSPKDDFQNDLSLAFALSMQLEQGPSQPEKPAPSTSAPVSVEKKPLDLFGSDSIYYRNTSMFASLMKPIDGTQTSSSNATQSATTNSFTTTHTSNSFKSPPPPPTSTTIPGTTQKVLDSDISDSEDAKNSDSSQDDDDDPVLPPGQRMTKGMQPILERRGQDHHIMVKRKVDSWVNRVDPTAKLIEQNENMIERMKDRHRQQYKMVAMRQQQSQPYPLPSGVIPPYPGRPGMMDHGPMDLPRPVPIDHGMVYPGAEYVPPVIPPVGVEKGPMGMMEQPAPFAHPMVDQAPTGHMTGTPHYAVPPSGYIPSQPGFMPQTYQAPQPGYAAAPVPPPHARDHPVPQEHQAVPAQWEQPTVYSGDSMASREQHHDIQRESPAVSQGNSPVVTPHDRVAGPAQTTQTATSSVSSSTAKPPVKQQAVTSSATQDSPSPEASESIRSTSSLSVASSVTSLSKPAKSLKPSNTLVREGEEADDEDDSDSDARPIAKSPKKKKQVRQSRSVPNLKKKKKSKSTASSQDGRSPSVRTVHDDNASAASAPHPASRQKLKHTRSEPDIPKQKQQQQQPHYASQPNSPSQSGQRRHLELQSEWDRMQAYQREQQLKQHYTQQYYARRQQSTPSFVPHPYGSMDSGMLASPHLHQHPHQQRPHYPVQQPSTMPPYYQHQHQHPHAHAHQQAYYSLR